MIRPVTGLGYEAANFSFTYYLKAIDCDMILVAADTSIKNRTPGEKGVAMFHPKGPTFWELTRQVLSSTERGYDLLAEKFEWTPFRTPDTLLEITANQVGPAGRVLDVCCGTGAALRCFHPFADHLVGLDFSQGMLAEAKRRLPPQADNIQLHYGNAVDLPFLKAFDTALCFGALGHIRRRDENPFLSGIFRALKPGGRFLFISSTMPPIASWQYWFARGFNAAIHLRNLVMPARFTMFYLTFLWPQVKHKLEGHGFEVTCHSNLFPSPYSGCLLIEARVPQ